MEILYKTYEAPGEAPKINQMMPASSPNTKQPAEWLTAWRFHCLSYCIPLCIGIESVSTYCLRVSLCQGKRTGSKSRNAHGRAGPRPAGAAPRAHAAWLNV